MVPSRPGFEIVGSDRASAGTRRVHRCESIVERHVKDDRDQNRADEIEQTANEQIDRTRFLPSEDARDHHREATNGGAEEGREKPSIDHRHINGLHCGNSWGGREARQRSHDEGRKCEEDSGDEPAAKR